MYSQHQHHSRAHTPSESDTFIQRKSKLFSYMITRKQMCNFDESTPQFVIKGLQGYQSCTSGDQSIESSESIYL